MEKGAVVAFSVKGQPRLAVVEGLEGKQSLKVTDILGNSSVVALRDLEFSSIEYRVQDLKLSSALTLASWLAKSEERLQTVDLKSVWELLSADSIRTATLEDLGGWLWDTLDGPGAYALYRSLKADRIYFKEKGKSWEVRTADQVAEAEKQVAALAAKEQVQAELRQRLTEKLAHPDIPLTPEEEHRLQAVQAFALFEEEAPGKNVAMELLGLLNRPKTPEGAFQLLVALGLWSRHQNLPLLRSARPLGFSAEHYAEAQRLCELRLDLAGRKDFTNQYVVTIDDETTTEIDDGLAVDFTGSEPTYWIHIADPAAWITEGSLLDREARQRGATLYLPDGRYAMFPELLAEGPFSLRVGEKVPALSFACRLDGEGQLSSYEVHLGLIQPRERLSYVQAQQLLSETQEPQIPTAKLLLTLDEAARRREAWRQRQGAISINLPESHVHVDLAHDSVEVGVYPPPHTRDLVAEFMILAGEACARWFQDRQVPVLYRFQPPSENPPDLSVIPAGPAREFAKILSMSRSGQSLTVQPHTGLGLSAYVQATSPIRRYSDLAVHRQIHAVLEGLPVRDGVAWETLGAELDPLASGASKLERLTDRYWIIEYLRRQKGKVWEAIVIGWFREDDRQAQILLTETGLRTVVKLAKSHALGETLQLKVASADPRKDLLTFQEA